MLQLAAITDKGLERELNEDAFAVCCCTDKAQWATDAEGQVECNAGEEAILIVCDGMGGAAAGDVASHKAIADICEILKEAKEATLPSVATTDEFKRSEAFDPMPLSKRSEAFAPMLSEAIVKADARLKLHAIDHFETAGMGTTIVIAWVNGNEATIAWCGDSRCYLYRQGEGLRRLTRDHSYVQQLVDSGTLHPDEAMTHPDSNIITKCLGDTDSPASPDTCTAELTEGDILMLCSDGLCGYCTDKTIESLISQHYPSVGECRDALLQAALATGGQDNITIALCAVEKKQSLLRSRLKNIFNIYGNT